MRYFDEYTLPTTTTRHGTISINRTDYADATITFPDGTQATLTDPKTINRAWHNDTVYFDNSYVTGFHTTNRYMSLTPGVIMLNDKQKYGTNKKGVPIYLFRPLSPHYPCMLVASNALRSYPSTPCVYALVSYLEWTTDQKYPRGQCEHILGACGDIQADSLARAHYHGLMKQSKLPKLPDARVLPLGHAREDFRDHTIFSIDPIGCVDIDDAIHLVQTNTITYEVGVHIADVTAFFDIDSDVDLEARSRAMTVYLPTTQVPILHESLSHNLCSLLPNQDRLALSCILTFTNNIQTSARFVPSIIRSKHALAYDDVDQGNVPSSLKPTLENLSVLTNSHGDSHKLVENLMLRANIAAAECLRTRPHPFILRNHITTLTQSADRWLQSILESSGTPASYIEATTDTPTTQTAHNSIGVPYYTHFTSPIRRYADQIVHRMIKDTLHTIPTNSIPNLNQIQKLQRRFKRDCDILQIVHKYPQGKHELEAVVLPFRFSSKYADYKVDVAIPSLQVILPLQLYHSKTAHVYEATHNDNHLTITNKMTNEEYQIQEGSTIKICLYTMPNEHRFKKKLCVLYMDK
jgi:exoribonuclease R